MVVVVTTVCCRSCDLKLWLLMVRLQCCSCHGSCSRSCGLPLVGVVCLFSSCDVVAAVAHTWTPCELVTVVAVCNWNR